MVMYPPHASAGAGGAYWRAPRTFGCMGLIGCMDGEGDCATIEYKALEYRIDNSNQLVRRVLDNNDAVFQTDIMARNINDFQASLSADQLNLVNVTPTTILLDAEQYDVGANFASNIFTAPVSGYYYINGNVTFLAASVIADVSYIGRITKGASTSIAEMWGTPSAVKEFSCVVSTTYYLTKGDTIKLTAYQASGGDTIDVDGHASAVFTYLEVRFLEN